MQLIFAHWVHAIDPFVVRLPEGWFTEGIRWYGVSYVLSFIIAAWLLHLYGKRRKTQLSSDQQTTLLTALIAGVFIGGSLGYQLLYDFPSFLKDPLAVLRPWEGGMASHGAFVGIALAILWFAKHAGVSLWHVGDLVVTIAPPGLFLGRIANFINGEVWGKVSDVSWAVIFPQSMPAGYPVSLIPARHPSQLYEAGLEGIVLGVYLQLRFWKSDVIRLSPGRLAGEFLFGYALLRIIGEFFREPDAALILSMSRGTFYSILVGGAGFAIMCMRTRKKAVDL